MKRHLACLVVLACAAFAGPADSQTQPAPPLPREQVEQIVRDYLLRNPELLIEVMDALEQKRQAASAATQTAAVKQRRDEILRDPAAPVAGNPSGDATIVEFFDYRCPYCKRVMAPLMQMLKEDGQLRFVFKELPILGPDSVVAARAALGAHAEGKYLAMHEALMRARPPYDEASILKIAGEIGLDPARLKAAMNRPEIDAALERNRALAQELAITGTPAFVIGERVVTGALDLDTLKKLVAEARSR